MSLEQLTTLGTIKQFLDGTHEMAFNMADDKPEHYRWVRKILVKHQYLQLSKKDMRTVTRYMTKVPGYSRTQIKRLIRHYVKIGTASVKPARRNGFKHVYTKTDIRRLASMDERHGQADYRRLAGISVSHLYNLRASRTYQRQRRCILTKTRAKGTSYWPAAQTLPERSTGLYPH